jgi:hypothetical protein
LLLYQHKNNIELNNHLQETMLNRHEEFQLPQTAEECKIRYDAALKHFKQLEQSKQKDTTHHDKHLAARAEVYANQNNVTTEKYLKRLRHAKSMARVFKRCTQARGDSSSGSFSTIEIPFNPDTHPKEGTE